jgi:hypothetical protein
MNRNEREMKAVPNRIDGDYWMPATAGMTTA